MPESVRELVQIATAEVPEGGGTPSRPVVTKKDSHLQVVICIYQQSLPNRKPTVSPPHQIIVLDPRSGEIVRNEPYPGKDRIAEEYTPTPITWDDINRFDELSPIIWEAFESGSKDKKTTESAKEYFGLLKKIVASPLMPYYQAVAPDFFQWLEKTTK